jgi:hypothetical protein
MTADERCTARPGNVSHVFCEVRWLPAPHSMGAGGSTTGGVVAAGAGLDEAGASLLEHAVLEQARRSSA